MGCKQKPAYVSSISWNVLRKFKTLRDAPMWPGGDHIQVGVLDFGGNIPHESAAQAETKAHCSPFAALKTFPLPSAWCS